MLSTYCQECGSKNEYISKKPKYCSECGEPLGVQDQKKDRAPPVKAMSRSQDSSSLDLDEEGLDIYEVPSLDKLDYEIEIAGSSNSFSLGQLMGSSEARHQEVKPKRGRPKKK
jgi:hypothetical protein